MPMKSYSDCGARSMAEFSSLADAMDSFADGNGVFQGYLFVVGTNLTSLSGLESMKGVNGTLSVRENPNLVSVAALSALSFTQNALYFGENALVAIDDELASLVSVGTNLQIRDEMSLSTIRLPSLESVGLLRSSFGFTSWTGLAVNIDYIPELLSFDAPRLKSMGGTLQMVSLSKIVQVPFSSLQRCDGTFGVYGNPGATEMNVTAPVLESAGEFTYNNNGLTEVSGTNFPSLTNISYRFQIAGNENLTTIDGFNLTYLGELWIGDNPLLETIDGFNSLRRIETNVTLKSNPALTSIDGLQLLEEVAGCCYLSPASLVNDLPACQGNLCPDSPTE